MLYYIFTISMFLLEGWLFEKINRHSISKISNLALNIAINFIRTGNVIHLVKIGSHIDLQEIKCMNAKSLYYKTQFNNIRGNDFWKGINSMGFKKNQSSCYLDPDDLTDQFLSSNSENNDDLFVPNPEL